MFQETIRRIVRVGLPKVYLQRFPLLLGAFLPGYVLFAIVAVPAMFRSTLVLTGRGLMFVTTFAIFAALIVMTTRRTIRFCGPARFGVDWPVPASELSIGTFLRHLVLGLAIPVSAAYLSVTEGQLSLLHAVAAPIGGLGLAAACALAAQAVYAWLVDANQPLPELALPKTRALMQPIHDWPAPLWIRALVQSIVRLVRPYVGPGYFTADGQIAAAHVYAGGMFAIFGALYWAAYFIGKPRYDWGVPPLVFVLLLVTFATIVLSGIAFLLDRNRLPTLLPVGAWMVLMAAVSQSDHYVRLKPAPHALVAPAPYDIARTRGPLLTVIAIDGGGIQAEAWADTVLTHLERARPGFHRSVGVISAISGGSVGTMYFVSALHADRPTSDQELDDVVTAGTRASLSEAAWGLTYADLWRALVPIFSAQPFEKDRGWAMEQAWRRNYHDDQVPTLSDWIGGVRAGWMPSIALNSTLVESGERFAFTTFTPPAAWNLRTVPALYPDHDIEMPTAARLSATFPYVTPIATVLPEPGIQPWHFADGGYYDNTGMGIAMRWLDTAMQGHESEFRNRTVAFIRIRSSPFVSEDTPKPRAWTYDTIGPIETLVNVRTAGQRERAETELEFLQRLWRSCGVTIAPFEFAFDLTHPPLSWQLTATEIGRLKTAWDTAPNTEVLRDYLQLYDAPPAGAGGAQDPASCTSLAARMPLSKAP